MNNAIVYDIEDLRCRLDSYLDGLSQLRHSEKYRELLGEAFSFKVTAWEQSIRRQKDMPFTMVVCGEFKRGKSSFINSLLGEDVVTTDVTTETITLNKISYGPHSNALVLEKGKRMLLTDEQLRREHLEEILEKADGNFYELELKRPIEFLKKVTIVDTPGLSDSLQDFSPMVIESLMQADAVIYIFSAIYPLSYREQVFLKNSVIPQKHTDLLLVANYVDMLRNDAELERMYKEIQSRIYSLMPGEDAYMISALDERCRQIGTPRPNEKTQEKLEANFAALRDDIVNLVDTKCDMVLPDRMERMIQGMQADLQSYLDGIARSLDTSEDALKEEQKKSDVATTEMLVQQTQAIENIKTAIQNMKAETETWLKQVILKMRKEIADFSSFDIRDVRKYYPIYCIDTLQDALSRCFDYHTDVLYDMLDEISGKLTKNMPSDINNLGMKASFRFVLNNKTWTKGDNVALALNFVSLNNPILDLVAKGVAGGMRDKEMSSNTQEVYQDIRNQYDKLEKSLPAVIANIYSHLEKQLSVLLQAYYSEKAADLKNQMEQMRLIVHRSTEEKNQIRQAVRVVRSMLEEMT